MASQARWEAVFKRDDLMVSEIRNSDHVELGPGEVRLAVEKFGLTANNATYARFGDDVVIPFWNAFPGPPGYGRVPIWSFVRVEESRNESIREGSRFFGYVPLATHHVVPAEPVPGGFLDVSAQREFLHPWYRTYQQVDEPDDLDDYRALARPIFPASFNLADFVAGRVEQGARSLLVTSASCKVAIGLAGELSARNVELPSVGITSDRNIGWLKDRGLYGEVLTYSQFPSVSVEPPAIFVDFTGDATWRSAPYKYLPGQLATTVLCGFTHPSASVLPPELPDPQPEVFFTPAIEQEAIAATGAESYYARYYEAERRYLQSMSSWLTITSRQGPEQIVEAFYSLLSGEQSPDSSTILRP